MVRHSAQLDAKAMSSKLVQAAEMMTRVFSDTV